MLDRLDAAARKLPPPLPPRRVLVEDLAFDDGPTTTLPSAERTFTDLEPFQVVEDDDGEEDLGVTLEVRPRRVTTLRLSRASLPVAATSAAAAPRAELMPRLTLLLRDRRAPAVGVGLFAACLLACLLGVLAGATPTHRAPFLVSHAPRIAVVAGAREAITTSPLTAPEKAVLEEPVVEAAPPPPRVKVRAAAPVRRPGFQRPATLRR